MKMDATLLKKIEKLTLYNSQLEKANRQQQQKRQTLRIANSQLTEKVQVLEAQQQQSQQELRAIQQLLQKVLKNQEGSK
ncbi:hypothetical protein IC229_15870 [Spirosoma sp. BT702]|uniref:Uncharacterized protein n=2 Tax=Spirosoma profusum TaxID=2771354 RepID=A0A926XWY7_9BACT|nr:hypothetical protein [Spirosoma profusum]